MPDDPTLDPFTRSLNALWAALAASPAFSRLVPVQNRINYTDASAVVADRQVKRAPADKNAKVRIVPAAGGATALRANSLSTSIMQAFRIETEDISQDVDKHIFPIKYAILTAIYAAGENLGVPSLITTATPMDSSENRPNAGGNVQWTAVTTVWIGIRISHSQIVSNNQ